MYLQTLEMIAAMKQYPIDNANPDEVIRRTLKKGGIDKERLILYARKHFNQMILINVIDVVLGGVEL